MKHDRHPKITKPAIGYFGRNEVAFLGAACSSIELLVEQLMPYFSAQATTYIDADHAAESEQIKYNALSDKINFKRFEVAELSEFQQKFLLNEQELIFVNGNHFQANKQVVLIHPQKEASLKKREKQLTEVVAFVLTEGSSEPYDWLRTSVPNFNAIPILRVDESEKLAQLIKGAMPKPPLKGLVLAGGKSTRMGEDKGLLMYHEEPQREFLYHLLTAQGIETYISCRADQAESLTLPSISDAFLGLGPYGAILSAFRHDPNAAWLIVACDMPFVNEQTIEQLVEGRNQRKTATAFYNSETQFPDPLLTIFEPKAYQTLLDFLALGYSCPRKVLINSSIELLQLSNTDALTNANTPNERAEILKKIYNKP